MVQYNVNILNQSLSLYLTLPPLPLPSLSSNDQQILKSIVEFISHFFSNISCIIPTTNVIAVSF